jgi:hypothetical protein
MLVPLLIDVKRYSKSQNRRFEHLSPCVKKSIEGERIGAGKGGKQTVLSGEGGLLVAMMLRLKQKKNTTGGSLQD